MQRLHCRAGETNEKQISYLHTSAMTAANCGCESRGKYSIYTGWSTC